MLSKTTSGPLHRGSLHHHADAEGQRRRSHSRAGGAAGEDDAGGGGGGGECGGDFLPQAAQPPSGRRLHGHHLERQRLLLHRGFDECRELGRRYVRQLQPAILDRAAVGVHRPIPYRQVANYCSF